MRVACGSYIIVIEYMIVNIYKFYQFYRIKLKEYECFLYSLRIKKFIMEKREIELLKLN